MRPADIRGPVNNPRLADGHTEPPMRSISIRQPWVWAILQGQKVVDSRSWGTSLGPVAIHAATRWDSNAVDSIPMREAWALHQMGMGPDGVGEFHHSNPLFPTGVILGVVDIVDVHLVDPVRGCHREVDALGCVAPIDGSDPADDGWEPRFCSPWGHVPDRPTHGNERGLKHLVLANPRLLAEPMPFTGHLNIRKLPVGFETDIRNGLLP